MQTKTKITYYRWNNSVKHFTVFTSLLLLMLLSTSLFAAQSAPILLSIKAKTLPSNMVRLDFHFSRVPPKPFHFTTENPPSIVLDFKGVTLGLKKTKQSLPIGVLKRYEAIQAPHKTRIVIKLSHFVNNRVRMSGQDIYLYLSGGIDLLHKTKKEIFRPINHRLHVTSLGRHTVKAIDFTRSPTGSGQLTIQLSDPNINIDVADKPNTIRVDLDDTRLPANLRRKFDVTAFGTAVQFIEATNRGRNALMLIRTQPPYQHMAYQINNKFVIDIKGHSTLTPINARQKARKYSGKRLSLNFQSISVRAALQLLAQFAKINIVVSDTVTGDITLRLHQIPWDQALEIILQTRGLGERTIGNTRIVAPAKEIATREKAELLTQQQLQVLEPLSSELLQINYGKASEIAELLKGVNGKSIISDRGSVNVDERTNTLWIQDTTQKLAEIRKLMTKLDMPVKQVLIEARIVNVDKTFEHELGVRWGITGHRLSGTLQGANQLAKGVPAADIPFEQRLNVNLPTSGLDRLKGGGAGSIALALTDLGSGVLLDLELSALQTEGNAKIIASPKLVTADQKEALIEAGEEIPYQEATSSGATSVSFKKAVLSLRVTPQITPDNRIILNLKINQDKRGPEVLLGVPSIDTQEINTQVLVNNGQTLVLGGIYKKTTSNHVERIPFFSEIPLIGHLFRYTRKEVEQRELLIFITPKIIKQSLNQI